MTKDEALSAKHEGATTVALKLALEALIGARTFLKSDTPVEVWEMNTIAINECVKVLAQPDVDRRSTESKETFDQQEPVALEDVYLTIIQWDVGGGKRSRRELARRIVAKYTTPPQPEPVIDKSAAVRIATSLGWEPKRKPLTDEEIDAIPFRALEIGPTESFREFARAIEAAHGIKE